MTKQFSYGQIRAARELLGLPEKATLDMIKRRYRTLCHKWHPDVNRPNSVDNDKYDYDRKFSEITKAYTLIMDYCRQYQYSFTKEKIDGIVEAEDWWYKRFGNDPIWSPGYRPKED